MIALATEAVSMVASYCAVARTVLQRVNAGTDTVDGTWFESRPFTCATPTPVLSLILRNMYAIQERWSRGSAVGIATGYGLDDQGARVRVTVGARIFTSPCRPDRLWGPPYLLSNGYRR
jgi:hypothetical protein